MTQTSKWYSVGRTLPLKKRIRYAMSNPWTDAVILFLVLVSVLLLPIEFGLRTGHPAQRVATTVGLALTWLFIVELCVRFWVAPKKSRFFKRYWTDILAVLPAKTPLAALPTPSGHGSWRWLLAVASGHGAWPWPLANGLWPALM